jgi:signal transduction histidine kinase
MLGSAIKDSDLQMYLDIILRSSMRIHNLISQLLASQETDNVTLEKYSIVRLLDKVLATLADRIELDQVLVRKDYGIEECDILLNTSKVEIALTNIIVNAIDAMTAEKRELKLVTRSMESEYVLWIEDSGCGINKENLKLIFQPYYTKKVGGLGLGLAVAYDILRSNGVRIGVESEEGAGTRFILHFNRNRGYA